MSHPNPLCESYYDHIITRADELSEEDVTRILDTYSQKFGKLNRITDYGELHVEAQRVAKAMKADYSHNYWEAVIYLSRYIKKPIFN